MTAVAERPPAAKSGQPSNLVMLEVAQLDPSPTNPRKRFDAAKLEELAQSIRAHGVLQPIVARPVGKRFEVVAGERRYRATKLAEYTHIPAIVRELDDGDVLEIQAIENNQREDVHPLEECEAFKRLLDSKRYGEGQAAIDTLAGKLGRSTSYVYQRLKLTALTDEAKKELMDGAINAGHAALLMRLTPAGQEQCISWLLYESGWKNNKRVDREERRDPADVSSVRSLADHIKRNVHMQLGLAPFDRSNGNLLKSAPSCDKCPKRTGHDGRLFGESESDDRCLDRACYLSKCEAHVMAKAKELKAEGYKVFFVSVGYGDMLRGLKGHQHINHYEYKPVDSETGDKGIVISFDNQAFGSVLDISRKTTSASPSKGPDYKRLEMLEKRKIAIGTAYRDRLREAILDNLPSELDETCVRAIARATIDGNSGYYGATGVCSILGWSKKKLPPSEAQRLLVKKLADAPLEDLIKVALLGKAASELFTTGAERWQLSSTNIPAAESLAASLGIAHETILKTVRAENPMPEKVQTSAKAKAKGKAKKKGKAA